jgi:hypothetical protein
MMSDTFSGFVFAVLVFSALSAYWRSEYKMAMWMSFCSGAMLAGFLYNHLNTPSSQRPRPEEASNTVQPPSDRARAGANPAGGSIPTNTKETP